MMAWLWMVWREVCSALYAGCARNSARRISFQQCFLGNHLSQRCKIYGDISKFLERLETEVL